MFLTIKQGENVCNHYPCSPVHFTVFPDDIGTVIPDQFRQTATLQKLTWLKNDTCIPFAFCPAHVKMFPSSNFRIYRMTAIQLKSIRIKYIFT